MEECKSERPVEPVSGLSGCAWNAEAQVFVAAAHEIIAALFCEAIAMLVAPIEAIPELMMDVYAMRSLPLSLLFSAQKTISCVPRWDENCNLNKLMISIRYTGSAVLCREHPCEC
jgi:hypothetical protein